MERGKYQSLTMINWNGFFARTFDIDDLVTTLSGGNGAGKSTTMAAFITTLIPDQSLLHFRNTTEAGSSTASRDKGLHGKLKPGVCYSALDVINSKKQRTLFGVKLQQVAGRDKKVDIKPFIIQGLPSSVKPTDVLMESISDTEARVRQLNEVKQVCLEHETVQFKAFSSVVEFHNFMFEFGVLPKKLRNTSDRSKFYRLIEASLYGGISSAITKSLRDYLLPQNGGVKKAFQDMEAALRENRMTLEAIKVTQNDRDLFKHLISEATTYVAADYMRHVNERRLKVESTLQLRAELQHLQHSMSSQLHAVSQMQVELGQLKESEQHLEVDHQAASDHLQLVQTAVRQQEKITRYNEDLLELSERLEEQMMVVEEASEQLALAEESALHSEEEVDSLKSQLADYQQALDVQQTRALQYQQAVQALEKVRQLCDSPNLAAENAQTLVGELKHNEVELTQSLLAIKHRLDLSQAAMHQFDNGLALVRSVCGDVPRQDAAEKARELLQQGREMRLLTERSDLLKRQHENIAKQVDTQHAVKQWINQYQQRHGYLISAATQVESELESHHSKLEFLTEALDSAADRRSEVKRELRSVEERHQQLAAQAPAWIEANEALELLQSQYEQTLPHSDAVMEAMQNTLNRERDISAQRDALGQQKQALEKQIENLSQPGGSDDNQLRGLADALGGILLSEIYDDITLDDAPFFSAMYGPARHAIVVPDLSEVKEKLARLDACPDDLYIIEGDADAFDDNVFDAAELADAVCVQLNDRQLRYSRFPKVPLFGRAAREQRLEQLRQQREALIESHAKAAFDSQKLQRLYQSFNRFVGRHLAIAFDADPEQLIVTNRDKRNQLTRQLSELENTEAQQRSQVSQSRDAIGLLSKLQPHVDLIGNASLTEQLQALEVQLQQLNDAASFLRQHGETLTQLEQHLHALDADPEQFDQLAQQCSDQDSALQQLKAKLFACEDLLERKAYFAYADAVQLLGKSSELNDELKRKLDIAEQTRQRNRDQLKLVQGQNSQYNQLLASLKSAHQAKNETVQEFVRELQDLGVHADAEAEERTRLRRDDLHQQLQSNRTRCRELEKSLLATEIEHKGVLKRLRKQQREYRELRKLVVNAKAGWGDVMHLAREHDVERRLQRREMAYKSSGELRSLSDKALGALRLAVADNDELRDSLRQSEDASRPERKVLFYIAVYQHLRDRIRHDIIRTDDPVEAIEEMEVELARLTEELTQREHRLAISSESVASIIRKTIVREQNRIRMLNQGLQNIAFGQVKGVRLTVKIRESHDLLLAGLAEQQEQHQDLFGNQRLSFSEAMAKLFQRLNPHIDVGQRSPQILGEELLDYRNYLELGVEVNRGSDGWLQAESGALSTGEAIGTGQSILLMVIQSWEEESRRLRGKDIIPCRLLFLDEAARLDAKSIATLFELCDRLDMQLLIAAPENISPEKGTTYKLVRKIFNGREHVHVVGLKGFGQQTMAPPLENTALKQEDVTGNTETLSIDFS
ncbi:chromosome partition protein MukB [Thaumasiovibrio sp. DFM-14]|uniref:chromosome partition protein MukB n=1 Tax=Thaumasiovibrio sp. DFM-14 TaxID=3384792 RepID=UPI0039A296DE